MTHSPGTRYALALAELQARPRRWLVTGAAGFIGSHLAEHLLRLGQEVVALDNLSTGSLRNVDAVREADPGDAFRFIQGDVRDPDTCRDACAGVQVVLHQAALGSVPRSIANPVATHENNVDGFVNVLEAARGAGVGRFVFAASSSVYGDHPGLPKREDVVGRPLSPYAVSKYVGELYAEVYHRVYGTETVGLRYFNVFGPRQDPHGAYAAVIPRWVANLLAGEPCRINGDGQTTRDFCYVDNVVQANLLAATVDDPAALGIVYNIAVGEQTSLEELFQVIRDGLTAYRPDAAEARPEYGPFAPGDVRHSLADLTRARELLGYAPTHGVRAGMREALAWYAENAGAASIAP